MTTDSATGAAPSQARQKPLIRDEKKRDSKTIARSYHLPPTTNLSTHDITGPTLHVQKGNGIYIYDDEGKEYIEGMSGLWNVSLGFSEKRLVEAATKQLNELPYYHLFSAKAHDPAIDLAEGLIKIAPWASKVFFANSGSEANDTVVKMVWYYNNALDRPKKKKIFSRIKAYHGIAVGSGSLTGIPKNHADFDLPIKNIYHTSCPHYYRYGREGESEEEYATRLAEEFEKMVVEQGGAEECAAFIAEPVLGAGGVIVPPKTYYAKMQAIVKKYDMLWIDDEVICGFGRLGDMWGAETLDIKPDILVSSKAISNAYLPLSCVMVADNVYQVLVTQSKKHGVFAHGFTGSGHPVACAVALEVLKIYEERAIVQHVKDVVPHFWEKLKTFEGHPLVGEVRGIGLIAALECVKDKATKEAFDAGLGVGAKVAEFAQTHGLIVRNLGDSIALCPPLIITEAQIDELLSRLSKALDDTLEWVKAKR
ncbi:aminotransferase [Gonapodya prolifera JEL478]|uniref:Aminotransferase n=1 Tax=Gonapodya prolifera (strain JEL478) TaxID=1344416 RepID=A0A138ZZU9_GONPJ|nr:aminotransferase [Gonapodya prolifera JEL478]|eukprot:KXS10031.1 aminotransferase [Gonapodya prolifera JEL478]